MTHAISPLRWSLWLLLAAVVLGAVLRLYHLDRNPEGIHPDEALYGYEGWSIMTTGCDYRLTGCPPLYLKGYSTVWDNRTSVLYPYMFSLLWRILPMTIYFERLPSVLFGLAIIVFVWLLGRKLFSSRPLVAGVAAVLVAVSPMAVSWSRVGHDPITVPFFCLLIAVSILSTPRRPWLWLVAGIAVALGMYSYQPLKIVGPFIALLSAWYVKPPWTAGQVRWFMLGALLMAGLALPFAINQLRHWTVVQGEFNDLSVFRRIEGIQQPWLYAIWNLIMYMYSLVTRPAIALTFVPVLAVVGVIFGWRTKRRAMIFCLGWILLALTPLLITIWLFAGNEMQSRSLGVTGLFELLAAYGLVKLVEWWRTGVSRRWSTTLITCLIASLAGLILLSGLINHRRGGFCCFVLGGMERVTDVLKQPAYLNRQVVISRVFFMQGVNVLWHMRVPPRAVQSPATVWEEWNDRLEKHVDVPVKVDRFRFCQIDVCYRPGDGALYVVPEDMLMNLPTIATVDLHLYYYTWQRWKIVDNSGPSAMLPPLSR